MIFNEDSRVKIPAILHLVRLGYKYLPKTNAKWDCKTNIFPEIFYDAVAQINPNVDEEELQKLLDDIRLLLDNEDLGKAFYQRLTERSGLKLIDFTDFSNNTFHIVTELPYKNGDDEFRPDIIKKYSTLIEPVFEQINKNIQQCIQLNQLRDWLLPMLMNGQVKID